jgi:Zn-dependent peptidase ImmA (M78 family)
VASRIPINPSVLIWARETSGFSLSELTKSKQFSNLGNWEAGNESPTYSQLEKLAEKYHRPVAVFFFPSPPREEAIERSLRALSDEDLATATPGVRFLFRKAKAFQLGLRELFEGQYELQERKLNWMKVLSDDPIYEITKQVRQSINVSLGEQQSWKDSDEALRKWRDLLAENGIFVFKEAFRDPNVSGFCIYDELFPVIYVNNSNSKNRQIFTIFHEVAHLIFKESYLDIFNEDFWNLEFRNPNHEEVKCNAFAAEFLVPSSDFRLRIEGLDLDNEDRISELANSYHVSREVILRRLLDQNFMTQNSYSEKIREWNTVSKNSKTDLKKGGGNYYNTKAVYLGSAYISLVLGNYYQGRINVEQASEYLDIKSKSFSGIEEVFLKQRVNNVRI